MKKMIVLSILWVLVSCKKKNQVATDCSTKQPINTVTYPNYSKLVVGNYWIYQRFEISPQNVAIPMTPIVIDSCYVEKDTLINGKVYFKYWSSSTDYPNPSPYEKNPVAPQYLRDSLMYLINSNGAILFASSDFLTTFSSIYITSIPIDTVCKVIKKMSDQNFQVSVPAGIFPTSAMQLIYNMWPNYSNCSSVRKTSIRYAENIGKVTEGFPFFVNSCTSWERRLIRYHLN